MSKIGRKPIPLNNLTVEVADNTVTYKGKNSSGSYVLPARFAIVKGDTSLKIEPLAQFRADRDINREWGLNRALLANELKGASDGFVAQLKIEGLGFKGAVQGSKIDFSLGYSHKINFDIPQGITVEIDKSGQNVSIKGCDKELVGLVASKIRELRPPEPYKGTGIRLLQEVILRKAGKTKS